MFKTSSSFRVLFRKWLTRMMYKSQWDMPPPPPGTLYQAHLKNKYKKNNNKTEVCLCLSQNGENAVKLQELMFQKAQKLLASQARSCHGQIIRLILIILMEFSERRSEDVISVFVFLTRSVQPRDVRGDSQTERGNERQREAMRDAEKRGR